MKHLLLLYLLLITLLSFGVVSKKPNTNSLGALQYQNNPYTYLEGSITGAAYVEDHALVVRIQPRGTFMLFTEDLLFCKGADDKIRGKQSPVVLTYETKAHHLVEGIGCHALLSVDEVKDTKGVQ